MYTMNHSVWTGVYSEAGLSVSITPLWLSLPRPLSTQTCLNTHTPGDRKPHMLKAKILYTRPWREHIMGLFWSPGSLDAIKHPNSGHPKKEPHFLHPQLLFDLC